MKKRALIWAGLLLAVALLAGFAAEEAEAECKGEVCLSCMGFSCVDVPTSGDCSCTSGISANGGRWCIAGGGVCTITY